MIMSLVGITVCCSRALLCSRVTPSLLLWRYSTGPASRLHTVPAKRRVWKSMFWKSQRSRKQEKITKPNVRRIWKAEQKTVSALWGSGRAQSQDGEGKSQQSATEGVRHSPKCQSWSHACSKDSDSGLEEWIVWENVQERIDPEGPCLFCDLTSPLGSDTASRFHSNSCITLVCFSSGWHQTVNVNTTTSEIRKVI